MNEKFEQLKDLFLSRLESVDGREALELLKNEFLGRKGELSGLMKELKSLSVDEKKAAGKAANEAKTEMEAAFSKAERVLSAGEDAGKAEKEWIDITEPGLWPEEGHLHPISQTIADITDIFAKIGFNRVLVPEIDWDYYAFESLNMPKDHPARDDWETFFVADTEKQSAEGKKGKIVLSPHTSSFQLHVLEDQKLPIRAFTVNRCYRRQSDISHAPMFHQFEILAVDENLTIANLKGIIEHFVHEFFGPERTVRLRPHHFRFTEPSFEIDISCDVCKGGSLDQNCRLCKSGWLELAGAGMTHPNVLKEGKVDTEKYSALAFAFGIERSLMMREGIKIDDIRILYKNDLRFVKQF